jgi:hypothetical protein
MVAAKTKVDLKIVAFCPSERLKPLPERRDAPQCFRIALFPSSNEDANASDPVGLLRECA